jgi:hypothetical protein
MNSSGIFLSCIFQVLYEEFVNCTLHILSVYSRRQPGHRHVPVDGKNNLRFEIQLWYVHVHIFQKKELNIQNLSVELNNKNTKFWVQLYTTSNNGP